ncbi:MAG: cytochrome b/b6 domain-containing protein [Rhodoblastus sp.]|nr:cytochrome b/b6 domain-containing protein [Rhodoblastus sp.]
MIEAPGPQKYSALPIAIHWIVAVCIVGLVPAGFLISRLDESPVQEMVSATHQAVGILVLFLTLLRLALRAAGRMPRPASVLTPFERATSRVTHFSLYALLIVGSLIGWLGVNAYGEDVSFFGLFKLPTLFAKDEALSDQIFALHLACAILIVLAVVAHVVAAFVHNMRDDGVMERMLPGR